VPEGKDAPSKPVDQHNGTVVMHPGWAVTRDHLLVVDLQGVGMRETVCCASGFPVPSNQWQTPGLLLLWLEKGGPRLHSISHMSPVAGRTPTEPPHLDARHIHEPAVLIGQ
jgi:hypothetical protein